MRAGACRAGLTLVELIIVILIVVVLITLGLPIGSKARDQAKDTVARANLRAVMLAELQYFDTHGAFTTDRSELKRIEPDLNLGKEGAPGSVYIVTGQSKRNPAVCLFVEAGSGWQVLYHSASTGTVAATGGPAECTRRMLEDQYEKGDRPRGDTTHSVPLSGNRDTVR